jgi:hypothetical protein
MFPEFSRHRKKYQVGKELKEKSDRQCIRIFVDFLGKIGRPVTGVDEWPEDKKQGEIDAVARPYAIQHTSVDALLDARTRNVQFDQVISGLEASFRETLGYRLRICWPWSSIQKGQNWESINAALKKWIQFDAARLSDGCHHISALPGVPFAFDVEKGGPIKTDGVIFSRYDPTDNTLATRLLDQLRGRHKKLAPLPRYRDAPEKLKTLLLLESVGDVLMTNAKLVEAFKIAFPNWPEELDELWFVERVDPVTVNVHDLCYGETWNFNPVARNVLFHSDCTARVCVNSNRAGTERGEG